MLLLLTLPVKASAVDDLYEKVYRCEVRVESLWVAEKVRTVTLKGAPPGRSELRMVDATIVLKKGGVVTTLDGEYDRQGSTQAKVEYSPSKSFYYPRQSGKPKLPKGLSPQVYEVSHYYILTAMAWTPVGMIYINPKDHTVCLNGLDSKKPIGLNIDKRIQHPVWNTRYL